MEEKIYYTVYETTNLLNGNKYRGVHKTKDMLDRYLGSGTILITAIKKYGRDSFVKDVLFCAFTEGDAYIIEAILVDKEWCDRTDTYNICVGGSGAVGSLNKGKKLSPEHIAKMVKWRTGRKHSQLTKDRIRDGHLGKPQTPEHTENHAAALRGRKHTVEHKEKISAANIGLFWFTNGTANLRFKEDDEIPEGWYRGQAPHNPHKKGWKLITDGTTTRAKYSDEDLPDGWYYGRLKTTAPNMCLTNLDKESNMAFKPANANKTNQSSGDYENRNYPVPKKGSRKARVSLIVDLGVQEREDFEDPDTGELKPQKPCQQVAVFADLVADTVDYGGSIGKQHYRLLLNNTFAGTLKGINFTATPPKDAKGNMIAGKPWGLHPANLLTKLAKAVQKPDVIESMDISELLNMPFMAQVEVKEKDSGKLDKDGEPIIYKNVNYKGAAEVPLDDDDVPLVVAELNCEPLCVTFADAKPEHIKFIRGNIIKQIKLANNYTGSAMQKAIEAFEAGNNAEAEQSDEAAPAAKAPVKKPKAPVVDEQIEDAPF